jgi:hypothetical protein
VSVLQQLVLPLDYTVVSPTAGVVLPLGMSVPHWTVLPLMAKRSYDSPVPSLAVSIVQKTWLPLDCLSCSSLLLTMDVSVVQQPGPPLKVSVVQKTALPMDMSVLQQSCAVSERICSTADCAVSVRVCSIAACAATVCVSL